MRGPILSPSPGSACVGQQCKWQGFACLRWITGSMYKEGLAGLQSPPVYRRIISSSGVEWLKTCDSMGR